MHANVNWERVTGGLELLCRFQSVTRLDGGRQCAVNLLPWELNRDLCLSRCLGRRHWWEQHWTPLLRDLLPSPPNPAHPHPKEWLRTCSLSPWCVSHPGWPVNFIRLNSPLSSFQSCVFPLQWSTSYDMDLWSNLMLTVIKKTPRVTHKSFGIFNSKNLELST